MGVVLGVDQLDVDANLVARPADTAFEHIAHTELAADLLRVDRIVPIGESGVPRDHEHVREPGQIGRQIGSDPVGKILLLAVIAEVGKRQHDNRQMRPGRASSGIDGTVVSAAGSGCLTGATKR